MPFIKKIWIDRDVQYPDRREIHKENGTIETVDIKRAEGTIRKEGTQLNATNFNDLEDRISSAFSDASIDIGHVADDVSTLSGYVGDLTTAVAGKQDTLTAGTGISIVNNTISISLIDADEQEY